MLSGRGCAPLLALRSDDVAGLELQTSILSFCMLQWVRTRLLGSLILLISDHARPRPVYSNADGMKKVVPGVALLLLPTSCNGNRSTKQRQAQRVRRPKRVGISDNVRKVTCSNLPNLPGCSDGWEKVLCRPVACMAPAYVAPLIWELSYASDFEGGNRRL